MNRLSGLSSANRCNQRTLLKDHSTQQSCRVHTLRDGYVYDIAMVWESSFRVRHDLRRTSHQWELRLNNRNGAISKRQAGLNASFEPMRPGLKSAFSAKREGRSAPSADFVPVSGNPMAIVFPRGPARFESRRTLRHDFSSLFEHKIIAVARG